jgi:hypothetical protein
VADSASEYPTSAGPSRKDFPSPTAVVFGEPNREPALRSLATTHPASITLCR